MGMLNAFKACRAPEFGQWTNRPGEFQPGITYIIYPVFQSAGASDEMTPATSVPRHNVPTSAGI